MEANTQPRGAPIMVQDLPPGARVRLRDNATAEVTGNPKDGSWLFIRYLTHPGDPSQVGTEGLAYAGDVIEAL